MTARERILRAVRAAQTSGVIPRIPEASQEIGPPEPSPGVDECLARFRAEAAALGIELYVEESVQAVLTRLESLVSNSRVLRWSAEHLPYGAATVLPSAMTSAATLDEQACADVGVTGCDAAVAETGSLVLFSAPGRARNVSLLPPVHVALVEQHKLCWSMADVFTRHRAQLETSASCTVITGPSRTADIELTLTLGIHGPGRVAIVFGP